jgi:hypothetical protein
MLAGIVRIVFYGGICMKKGFVSLAFGLKKLVLLLLVAAFASLVFSSCGDLFASGIPVKNDTNWTIQVCFSADRQTADGGWTSISSKKTEKIDVNDGNWYIGVKSDDRSAPASAQREDNSNAYSLNLERIKKSDISSITITFQDGQGARYIYTINSGNRSITGQIGYTGQIGE